MTWTKSINVIYLLLVCNGLNADISRGFPFPNSATNSLETGSLKMEDPFAFFDIPLTSDDTSFLSSVLVKRNFADHLITDLPYAKKELMEIFKYVLMDESAASKAASIAVRVIDFVTLLSQASDALVSVIAYSQEIPNYSPDWHIDKSSCEKLRNRDEICASGELVFIFSLSGSKTLYFSGVNAADHEHILELCSEQTHSYCDIVSDKEFSQALSLAPYFANVSRVQNASHAGQMSVHIAGREQGAFHASPSGGNRLLLTISPTSSTQVTLLKKLLKK